MVDERTDYGHRLEGKNMSPHKPDLKGIDKRNLAIKGGIALAIILALFLLYMLMVSVPRSKVRFVLTDHEVQNLEEDIESQKAFTSGSKIYFLINKRNGKELNAGNVVLEIAKTDEGKSSNRKQISFEIDKDFTKLTTFIPVDYFRKKGKYTIKAFLDGKPLDEHEIEIE